MPCSVCALDHTISPSSCMCMPPTAAAPAPPAFAAPPHTHSPLHPQQEAQAARAQTDGYELDRNHHFKVSMFDDFERYARVPDEYAAPEAKEYAPTVRGGKSGGLTGRRSAEIFFLPSLSLVGCVAECHWLHSTVGGECGAVLFARWVCIPCGSTHYINFRYTYSGSCVHLFLTCHCCAVASCASPPPPSPQEQLHSWMLDKTGRDQFVVKHGDEVVILWNDGRRCRADEAYKRAFWTGGCRHSSCNEGMQGKQKQVARVAGLMRRTEGRAGQVCVEALSSTHGARMQWPGCVEALSSTHGARMQWPGIFMSQ
jgi:hypothetical protein